MTPIAAFMFWVMLPVALYASVWAYDRSRP
jgi:hypothetical protein